MRHGVRGSYVRGCHCEECTEANRAYVARTERAKLYGTWESAFTDAAPVRAHPNPTVYLMECAP